jgi:hypothetical protein
MPEENESKIDILIHEVGRLSNISNEMVAELAGLKGMMTIAPLHVSPCQHDHPSFREYLAENGKHIAENKAEILANRKGVQEAKDEARRNGIISIIAAAIVAAAAGAIKSALGW